MSDVHNTRIILTHDVEENWSKVADKFIPKAGEQIIYDPDDTCDHSRIKIGDGIKTLNEISFVIQSDIYDTLGIVNDVLILDGGQIG